MTPLLCYQSFEKQEFVKFLGVLLDKTWTGKNTLNIQKTK